MRDMNKTKKNTSKTTEKLPLSGGVKKGFHAYCVTVLTVTLALGLSMTAFADGTDPLTVISNLSDFIFGLIRAVGMILLG